MLHIFFLNIILASGSSQLTSFHMHVFRHTCLQCPRLRSEADSSALKPCPASSPAPCRRGPVLRIGCCWAAAGWSCHLWSKPPSLCCCCCPDDCVCCWNTSRGRYIYDADNKYPFSTYHHVGPLWSLTLAELLKMKCNQSFVIKCMCAL